MPPETLNWRVVDPQRRLVAVLALGWPSFVTGVEGASKDAPDAGAAGAQALEERRRRNDLMSLGVVLLRFTWTDLRRPEHILHLLRTSVGRRGIAA
jgi:hypothetical protein